MTTTNDIHEFHQAKELALEEGLELVISGPHFRLKLIAPVEKDVGYFHNVAQLTTFLEGWRAHRKMKGTKK